MTQSYRQVHEAPAPPARRRTRALVVLALGFAGAVAGWLLMNALGPEAYTRSAHIARAAASLVLGVALWAGLTRWYDGRLPRLDRPVLRRFGWGFAWYAGTAGAVTVALLATGLIRFELHGSVLDLVLQTALLLVLVLALEAIPEELIMRDLIQRSLTALAGRWLAVVGQAVLFVAWGWLIGAATSIDRIVLFFVFSIVQGLTRMWTGTVAATIGFHAAFQLLAQLLLGDSWPVVELIDPDRWFELAVAAPALVVPLAAYQMRTRSAGSSQSPSPGAVSKTS